jgi:Transglycosylase SLT domain
MSGNFYTNVIQRDPRFHSTQAIKDVDLLEPGFLTKANTVMGAAKSSGIELVITETYRSSERQQQLFVEGKTRLKVVGVHHYGLACDFAKVIDGNLSWEGDWTFLTKLAAANGVIAGGDWGEPNQPHSFRDWDHLQGVTLAQQTALFAGTWYPGGEGVGTVAPIPAAAPASPLAGLTPEQAAALTVFDKINAESFSGWFLRSSGMAFMEVESNFNPQAFRQEPSGVASYGLMQVLDATAHGLGLVGDPKQMFDPAIGIFYGLKYAAQGWNFLATHFGRPPTLTEWCEGYNEGYGAAAQGRRDPAYSNKWLAARQRWSSLDAGGQNV